MIKHTIPATNRKDNRSVTLEVVTDDRHHAAEIRLSGALGLLPNGDLALAIDNESARALARSILDTVPNPRRR
jgi:hypothetical protein